MGGDENPTFFRDCVEGGMGPVLEDVEGFEIAGGVGLVGVGMGGVCLCEGFLDGVYGVFGVANVVPPVGIEGDELGGGTGISVGVDTVVSRVWSGGVSCV